MATATSNLAADNSSLANFKAWGQFISNGFGTTCGWTQTTDTGQVNWGTIASVPSSTYVYEIWKANDTQAGTTPIFVKMEYGFSSTQVSIRVTVGTGSNGSGTITGIISFNARVITNSNSQFNNNGAGALPCFISGDDGEFRMLMWAGTATAGITTFFAIERSKDGSGNKTTDYFTALYVNSGTASGLRQGQQTALGSLVTTLETNLISAYTTLSTASFNSTVAAFPIFPSIGKLGNPMLGAAVCVASDVADATTVTISSMYGSTHTYVSCKSGTGASGFLVLSRYAETQQNTALLMRYE